MGWGTIDSGNLAATTPIAHHGALIDRLGAALPAELDRLALPQTLGKGAASELTFRFLYCDVSFLARVSRDGAHATLRLTGDLGPMPYTIQAAQRRRRALRTLAMANRDTGLDWSITEKHCITVTGEVELTKRPLTPATMVAGAIGLLLRGEGYLRLLTDVLGEAECLNSSEAA
jgi:hypothetical protein